MAKKVMIVAAEASSSHFALKLLQEWKKQNIPIQAFGVGNQDMEDYGFERIGKSEEMAVVGASEIIEHFGKLKAVFNNLVRAAKERRPDLVIVMDYPEFNLYLSRKLFPLNLNVVYYVSPQVWAWRQGRVQTIKRFCKKVLVLFPFEVPFYQNKGVRVDFVGHPVLDDLDPSLWQEQARLERRRRTGIADQEIVLGLMPGSRRLEIKKHFAIQLEVARQMYLNYPGLKILIMVAPTVSREELVPYLDEIRFPVQMIKEDPLKMIQMSELVLVASGTATLQVALLERPMVIMYRMSFMTGLMAKLLVKVKFFGLVNLIANKEIVPERWQRHANAKTLFSLMRRYLDDPQYRAKTVEELSLIRQKLGDTGATKRVVESLKEFLQ